MVIREMKVNDLEATAKLLDDYRVFYGQESDYDRAYEFLKERFEKDDSVVFVAEDENKLVGFTQLYPIFTTVGLNRAYLLNDIYVDEFYRRRGLASGLMQRAFDYGEDKGASFIILETAVTNTSAQALYRKMGMHLEDKVYYFSRSL